jgi:hypothetical protein
LDGLGREELGLKDDELGELGGNVSPNVSRNIGARGALSVTGDEPAMGLMPGLKDW